MAIGDLDESVVSTLESVLFGTDDAMPEIQAGEAAVLIEVIKDMVCQCYIRTAKLCAALKMRRYFAEEQANKITSIDRRAVRAESA